MKISTLCYVQDKNNYLMIHKIKKENDLFKDFWNGVGGKLETNESPEECAIRETYEETGLKVKNPTLKGIITFPNNHDSGETWYVFVYLIKEFKGTVIESDEGTLQWIPIKDINKLNIQNADRHFLKWIQNDQIFSAKFYYTGNELIDFTVSFY